ncbi:MAG: ferritin-like fold-containing protein [Microbacteriaceae bacterium]|nr:ferritin-like fold-containing protein [Microbacteriaceae bacterium]
MRKKTAKDTTIRVELADFAPGIMPFLSIAALTQLSLYEAATKGVLGAPDLESKGAMAEIAAAALKKHKSFTAEITRRGSKPHIEMAKYQSPSQDYQKRTKVDDWHQHVLSVWLGGGLFESFLIEIAAGLKSSYKKEAIAILREDSGRKALEKLLSSQIAADATVADRLAMWGRRLVGDTLLLAREILLLSENRAFVATEMEPIFTEITAGHMQRMDSLGLTA